MFVVLSAELVIRRDCLARRTSNICKSLSTNDGHLQSSAYDLQVKKEITRKIRSRFYAAVVRTILLYGCETRALRVEDMKRLKSFDNDCLRLIKAVSVVIASPVPFYAIAYVFKHCQLV